MLSYRTMGGGFDLTALRDLWVFCAGISGSGGFFFLRRIDDNERRKLHNPSVRVSNVLSV